MRSEDVLRCGVSGALFSVYIYIGKMSILYVDMMLVQMEGHNVRGSMKK
jgi:hypothetical protein